MNLQFLWREKNKNKAGIPTIASLLWTDLILIDVSYKSKIIAA